VDKKREIYFINNVKFHIDTVDGAGSFIEIEAIDNDGSSGRRYYWNSYLLYGAFQHS
jgi:adenylate cyclase class IV